MDAIVSQLEQQENCTSVSGLALFLGILKFSLQKCYPKTLDKPIKKEYDFIVVGAGAAGCIVASRLSEDPKLEVLLVEAGGEEYPLSRIPGISTNSPLVNPGIDWHYRTEPHPEFCDGQPCPLPRAKMMGGCDSHNGMWYLMPNRRLHDEMTKRGIEGWTYEEMLPYYRRRSEAREILENGSEVDMSIEKFPYIDRNFNIIQQAYREMGFSEPSNNGDNNQDYKTTSKNGERISSNRLYISKCRNKRANLQVSTATMVGKVVMDCITKTATGVEMYVTEGEKKEKVIVKARKEVIVCGGVINSPQVLQLSGIGPKNVLEPLKIKVVKDLAVGYNFQNHPSFTGTIINLTSTSTVPPDCDVFCKDIRNYVTNRSGPFASCGGSMSYLIFNSSYSTKEYPDLMLVFVPLSSKLDSTYDIFSLCYYNRLSTQISASIVANRGTISCISKNPFIHPKIEPGFDKKQICAIAQGCIYAHKLANSETFKKNGMHANNVPDSRCKDKEYGSYDYWICALKGQLQLWPHGISSCRMGPKNDPLAVVDSKCKVHGINGLRVIDASIIPILPNVNSNALVLATAERCVDFIKTHYA